MSNTFQATGSANLSNTLNHVKCITTMHQYHVIPTAMSNALEVTDPPAMSKALYYHVMLAIVSNAEPPYQEVGSWHPGIY